MTSKVETLGDDTNANYAIAITFLGMDLLILRGPQLIPNHIDGIDIRANTSNF